MREKKQDVGLTWTTTFIRNFRAAIIFGLIFRLNEFYQKFQRVDINSR